MPIDTELNRFISGKGIGLRQSREMTGNEMYTRISAVYSPNCITAKRSRSENEPVSADIRCRWFSMPAGIKLSDILAAAVPANFHGGVFLLIKGCCAAGTEHFLYEGDILSAAAAADGLILKRKPSPGFCIFDGSLSWLVISVRKPVISFFQTGDILDLTALDRFTQ